MTFLKGLVGEEEVDDLKWVNLDHREYHFFRNLRVPINGGRTQIDHVVVSRYGVFVVETKNRSGWIFGSEDDEFWTECLNRSTRVPFRNPLHQNDFHTESIAQFCAIDYDKIHPVVVFCGHCEFKRNMPEEVVKSSDYIRYIKSKHRILLGDAEVGRVCRRLQAVEGNIPIASSLVHEQVLQTQRNLLEPCPWCEGTLVVRIARRGRATGQSFLGCSNYPICHFKKQME